jgi:hypothetical protein
MNIQDLIDDCNKQIEWINNKDEYNVNALQFASYFKERLIEINDRTCESCKHLEVESGVQPDGMYWQKINCTKGNVYDEWDYEIVSCKEWESKDEEN